MSVRATDGRCFRCRVPRAAVLVSDESRFCRNGFIELAVLYDSGFESYAAQLGLQL
jgi:hypothetical protein